MLRKFITAILIILLLLFVSAPLATLIRKKPTIAVTIRSWSMAPLITRGDLVFLWPAGEKSSFSVGQIVVFRAPEEGIHEWTLHRITGVDSQKGFITRGDANEYTDQEGSGYPPVKPEWIAGIVPTIDSKPLKIPLLGYLSLYLERSESSQTLIPVLVGALAAALVLDEIFKSKKTRRKEKLSQGQLCFLGGLAVALLMASLMLSGSLFITFPYGVEENPGVLMGSNVGILALGTSQEIELAELNNSGFIPTFYFAVSSDPQVVLEQCHFTLAREDVARVTATVYAQKSGLHQASVIVGIFLPFLPPGIIGDLAQINFWLALIAVALVPAMPVFVIPYLEPRYRRRLVVFWRQRFNKFTGAIGLMRR